MFLTVYTNQKKKNIQSRCGCWFLSRLNALKRSRPRKTLSRFIPAMPKRASGSTIPFSNLGASTMSLYVIKMWQTTLAKMNIAQLSIHSTLTTRLLASRSPAIRRTFLTWRKMEWSWQSRITTLLMCLCFENKFAPLHDFKN